MADWFSSAGVKGAARKGNAGSSRRRGLGDRRRARLRLDASRLIRAREALWRDGRLGRESRVAPASCWA